MSNASVNNKNADILSTFSFTGNASKITELFT